MSNYLSWTVAFALVLVALVVLGASAQEWAAFVGIVAVIAVGLAVQAIVQRRRTR